MKKIFHNILIFEKLSKDLFFEKQSETKHNIKTKIDENELFILRFSFQYEDEV